MTIVESRLVADRSSKEIGAVSVAYRVAAGLFAATALINVAAVIDETTPLPFTHLAAALLSIYLFLECSLYLRSSDSFGVLSPAFLALIFHFSLAYLVPITAASFQPRVMERFNEWLPDLDASLFQVLVLCGLAAFCMLRGYTATQPIARALRCSANKSRLLRSHSQVNLRLVWGMQVVFLVFVSYSIDLGIYGMLSTKEELAKYASVAQFIKLALAAGTLSFFLILLSYFKRREQGRRSSVHSILIALLMAFHILCGILSGFKSQVVMPLVIAGFAYFLSTGRAPRNLIVSAFVALILAYLVIEPYRVYLSLRESATVSMTEAIGMIEIVVSERERLMHISDVSLAESIVSRFDISGMTALAVNYVDSGALQAEKRREFQNSIYWSPILAYIPRAVWPGEKPSFSHNGAWFNQQVRGRWNDDTTSVGMGPIGYLYMAGGVLAVVLGFFGLGVLQALIFDGLARGGGGGLIIFLSVASSIILIPSSFGPALVGVLQLLPVALVGQMLLLRRSGAKNASRG